MTDKIAQSLKPLATPIETLRLLEGNPRKGDVAAVAKSYATFGQRKPIVARRGEDGVGEVLAGNHQLQAARKLGWSHIAVVWVDDDDTTAKAFALADNRTAELGTYDDDLLSTMIKDVMEADEALLAATGWQPDDIADLDDTTDTDTGTTDTPTNPTLADRFLFPPFTVLDARQGVWQDRKRAWLATGIDSGDGRETNLAYNGNGSDPVSQKLNAQSGGTSVFDPVLCELAYRWFSPPDGSVLDPFAGGSVRGIVAADLGRTYTGIDLRPEQVETNNQQWVSRKTTNNNPVPTQEPTQPDDYTPDLTPIETHGGHYVKLDAAYTIAGSHGGKVRTCWHLANQPGVVGLVTAGSRQSPQVNIVAGIAQRLGLPCRVHVPTGPLTAELVAAQNAGAEIVQHHPGYNNVIKARARDDAAERGWLEIPFGMECHEAVAATAAQVDNIPDDITRIVVPVGSGMSLAGIVTGLRARGRTTPVLGVVVGADPTKRLDKYAPGWREHVTLVESSLDYHDRAPNTHLGDLHLDPIYEAKCLPHLADGDMLWVVGLRQTETKSTAPIGTNGASPEWIVGDSADVLNDNTQVGTGYDLVFSCPPYADLEAYSDDPADLSNMPYDQFVETYRAIIAGAVNRLADDRFAVWVVGEVRDKKGMYRGLVPDTIRAFEDAGATFYNEAVLVTAIGTLSIRAGRQFAATRKLGKGHQNVLVFVKGDPKKATAACGTVEVASGFETSDGGDNENNT